jgi:hypothetical protein
MNPSKAQHFSVPALEDLFDELLAMSHYGIILTQQTKTLIPAAELIGFGGINSLPFSFFHIFQPPSDPARTSSPSMDGPDNIKRKESRESECRETAKKLVFWVAF